MRVKKFIWLIIVVFIGINSLLLVVEFIDDNGEMIVVEFIVE